MLILVDQAIPSAADLFGRLGDLRRFDGRAIRAADLADADALIVRSVTRVDESLLAGSNVRFVGSLTSGTDHVDLGYLARQGIRFAAAPGCNARPVAEYVLTVILLLAHRQGFDPRSRTLGVIGVGHVGSLVAAWANALGMKVLPHDPPRAAASTATTNIPQQKNPNSPGREPGVFSSDCLPPPPSPWTTRSDLQVHSDIVTLHVPLVRDGPYPTQQMVDARWLGEMKPGSILINTARGEVVCEPALIDARRGGRLAGLVVDVWAGEPAINEDLAECCDIATPHVAGYSVEAKRRAAETIRESLAEWAGLSTSTAQSSASPHPAPFSRDPTGSASAASALPVGSRLNAVQPSADAGRDPWAVFDALKSACPLPDIDARLRSAIAEGRLPERFDALRAAVQSRQESQLP